LKNRSRRYFNTGDAFRQHGRWRPLARTRLNHREIAAACAAQLRGTPIARNEKPPARAGQVAATSHLRAL
jgi:hypothetical protein